MNSRRYNYQIGYLKMRVKIKGPIFSGRSWREYMEMFNLHNIPQDNNILDVAAGSSSFTAHMHLLGYKVQAVDLLYDQNHQVLCRKCQDHLELLVQALHPLENLFIWKFFKNLEELKEHRMKACREFIDHYRLYKGDRYLKADILHLPFKDNSFSLVLCSHLLFIYDHRLDYSFHIQAIREMLRVSKGRVCLYPLVKHRRQKSSYVNRIYEDLQSEADMNLVKVNYQFRPGANEMLCLTKK